MCAYYAFNKARHETGLPETVVPLTENIKIKIFGIM